MVKLHKKFFAGDKVFAKVRGYPPWPAKVEKVIDPNSKNSKYSVYFYGTGETAVCKVEELYTYIENKAKFGKPLRRKFFHEGLVQLEQELKNDRNKASNLADLKEAGIEETRKEGDNLPTVSAADSDMDTGSLVIDEEEKKKSMKRRTFSTADAPEVKKRRGKAKSLSASTSDSVKQDALDSQGEESPKEVVSRSGRKIKPKRFADFSSSEETDVADKNEHGRGRPKVKIEDSNDQVTPSTMHKKRALEKKNNLDETPMLEGTVVSGATSSDIPGRVLLALTFAGEYVGIKLDMDKPKSFESEKARAQWEWSTARNAMKMKAQLESGEILPEQIKDYLDFNVHVPDEEKRLLAKDGALHRKTNKLRWLRIEAQLLQLDAQIKSNLGLDRAYPDKCLQAMDEMLSLPIDPLMLKKHPHIVGTVKRLRRYIGNLADWKLSDEEEAIFKQKAEQIRQKSEHIYNKFKAMFTIPEGQSFWQSFSDQVFHFKELTKDMPEEKVFSLMSDPACPDATISEDLPADESGSRLDTDAPAVVKLEVPTRSETPKESEAK
ncbi:PC4 and SFRS1-interacting protein [Apis mellifera caucasica]|uniref:PC4 and SFRS1-interacting protein n=1 Tax=Apis mellifera TaxID=7460 RepID=A0A7M7RBI0_APIME|nr:PC4 and SFRS1-interacting protein [Apis mellifera]KAG6799152.1 PC4 and SFRS1-interacting protein [Apis mellifera caucasica]KAG9437948.1 PC4 and SFRS1-interacting protein [Apis mellifera carnica]|eukprot:XP_624711.1 PC4 and SFRS1-interacting protein [Apis mellifera]